MQAPRRCRHNHPEGLAHTGYRAWSSAGPLRREEPLDRALEAGPGLGQQLRVCLEVGVGVDLRERPRASASDELEVLGQAGELQIGHARLPGVEQRALTAESQVLVGELEA